MTLVLVCLHLIFGSPYILTLSREGVYFDIHTYRVIFLYFSFIIIYLIVTRVGLFDIVSVRPSNGCHNSGFCFARNLVCSIALAQWNRTTKCT